MMQGPVRIVSLDRQPLAEIIFLNAARRGGVETQRLPIVRAEVERLPDGLSGLLVTSDLQGVAPDWAAWTVGRKRSADRPDQMGANALLGVVLASEVERLAIEDSERFPPVGEIGVVLAGDLYSVPEGNKRGASGDVREVWQTFGLAYRWVAGVAGNHDRFGSEDDMARFVAEPGIAFLDGDAVELDQLTIAGVSWIIGNPAKPGRRSSDDFFDALGRAIDSEPDILVLHEPPEGGHDQRGNREIRELVELGEVPLTVCGHSHWDEPLAELASGCQVLNVDARAVLLCPADRNDRDRNGRDRSDRP